MWVDPQYATFANVAFYTKETDAFGVGIELSKKADVEAPRETYAIASLYLPREEYSSIKQTLPRVFIETFAFIPDTDRLVMFNSTSPYFRHNLGQMERRAGVYSGGVATKFRQVQNVSTESVSLAIDAVRRRSSITEVL